MIINIKQLIFEQLEATKENSTINDLVFENFTPAELEKQSMSHQQGRLFIINGNLVLETNNVYFVFGLSQDLSILEVNESIECDLNVLPNITFSKNDVVSEYTGGGALTESNGIDFEFVSPCIEGKYFLEERTGFSSKVKLTRLL